MRMMTSSMIKRCVSFGFAAGTAAVVSTSVPLAAPQAPAATIEMNALEKQFQEAMTNVSLIGYFTVGDGATTMPDRYNIASIRKIDTDVWSFDASIQYGNKNFKATVQVPVKWAGDTPVLTLSNYMIQGQGVYSARILIHNGMYAGTWGAAEKGGKMFGRIVKNDAAP
jgi:hypothetical protein